MGRTNEFGFDYLRDNMVADLSQRVQRRLAYAIVDEVDNILIDEARTPLIISGPAEDSPKGVPAILPPGPYAGGVAGLHDRRQTPYRRPHRRRYRKARADAERQEPVRARKLQDGPLRGERSQGAGDLRAGP